MANFTEKIGDHLNDILEKNIDAQKGFQKAAEKSDHSALAGYFKTRSSERSAFINELKAELSKYGEKYKKSGSASASLHRGWMDIKSMFSGDDDEAMLEESIKGEKAALKEYDEALKPGELPESTATLLRNQRDKIQAGINKIRSMEDLH